MTDFGPWIGTILSSGLTAYVLVRSRTPRLLKDELDVVRQRCLRLEGENKDLVSSNHTKDVEIADLKARTDLSEIQKTQEKILVLCSTTAQHMSDVARTLERVSASVPLLAAMNKTPPPTA